MMEPGAHSQAQRRLLPSESTRTRLLETTQLWPERTPEAKADHEARSQPHSGPRQERTTSGIATSQALATTTAPEPTTSTRAEGTCGAGVAAGQRRAARGVACEEAARALACGGKKWINTWTREALARSDAGERTGQNNEVAAEGSGERRT